MRRVFLFLLTNILVMATISIVMKVLGLEPYLTEAGINYGSLMVFCGLWGMGGAFISLALSKQMAKWSMRLNILNPDNPDHATQELVQTVYRLAKGANLPKMPEIGVYDSPEVNAFATGPSKSNSLVAVSTGLLHSMNRDEVEGVLGHEIAHIANGDMVTMTLIQGVINAFVMFFARIAAFAIAQALRDEEGNGPGMFAQYAMIFFFDMVFGILGSMVVMYFSRQREYRADAGGARLAGRDKMVGALQSLQRASGQVDASQPALATLKISGKPQGISALFMSHPPLEERIRRLKMSVTTG